MLGEKLAKVADNLDYLSADKFIESLDDRKTKLVLFNVLRKYRKAFDYADDKEKEQLVKNALMVGDYKCVKKSKANVDWNSFVKEKVLPYLFVFSNNGEYFVDEDILFNSLRELGEDYKSHIKDALQIMESKGFYEPMKKYILANYSECSSLIRKYEEEIFNTLERNNIEDCLKNSGVKIERLIQKGDDKRFFPKDGYLFLADINSQKAVLKEILTYNTDCSRLDGTNNESKVLRSLNNPHIVKYLGNLNFGGHDFVALEYIDTKPKPEGVEAVMEELEQILKAYNHMQSKGILYLDFKAKNILYDGSNYKIVDFGWAQFKKRTNYTEFSTPKYVVPETAMTITADEKSDMFALGVYLHKRLTNTHPFAKVDIPDKYSIACLLNYVGANCLNEWNSDFKCYKDPKVYSLIGSMLEKNPDDRLSFNDLKIML